MPRVCALRRHLKWVSIAMSRFSQGQWKNFLFSGHQSVNQHRIRGRSDLWTANSRLHRAERLTVEQPSALSMNAPYAMVLRGTQAPAMHLWLADRRYAALIAGLTCASRHSQRS